MTDSSPYQSEDEIVEQRPSKTKPRGGKKAGGIDLEHEESCLRKIQQEAQDTITSFTEIRNKTQGNTRKIHDLQVQFEEARVRIDKLLSRKSRSFSDMDGVSRRTSVGARKSSSSSVKDRSGSESFAPVSLTVNVEDDQDC